MRRTIPLLAVFTAVSASAPAVVWRNDIDDADVLAFGNTSQFIGVGELVDAGGTGTYIGRGNGFGWVLTANHVLTNGETSAFRLPGLGTWQLNNTYRIPGTDVSIARLVNFNLDIFAPQLNTAPIDAGALFVSAGFGLSREESLDDYNDDGRRRGYQSRLTGIETRTSSSTGPGTYVIDRFDSPTDPNVQPLEGFGAPGDSGSMVLSAQGIVGVLSFGDYEKYGAENRHAALTPAVTQQIFARTGIVPVPEPATLAALGVGALALLRRRKRA